MPPVGIASVVDLLAPRHLPELAQALRSRIEPLMLRWEQQVRQLLPGADKLTFDELRDDSLLILGQLATAISSNDAAALALLTASTHQHAGLRFAEEYNLQELIAEYSILRRLAAEEIEFALGRGMSLTEQVTLHITIDAMFDRGVMAFVACQEDRLRLARAQEKQALTEAQQARVEAEQARSVAESATAAAERAKDAIEQARAAAEAASAAKDRFLAVLSHELRTPLTPVLTTAALLQTDPRFDADTRAQLELMHRNAELEARLIDDLLDVTRIDKSKITWNPRAVGLCTILNHAAEVCRPDIEARKLHFGVEISGGPYAVYADPARLQQAFWNLLKNAIKFTHVGGCVGIRCRRDGDAHVIAEVTDSGEGIDPAVLPRLFNAFEQGGGNTTRKFGGLGLGLTIAKAMVEMHGGTIEAHSQGKGKGATFAIRLPLLPDQAAALADLQSSEAASLPAPAATAAPLRILLVEDHGDTARIMSRVLSAHGHDVELAADVETALKLAAEHPFDLLLSDLGLPDGTGMDLMRALRQRGQTLPGIALSGYGQEQDMEQSREAGFAAHLVKPVNLSRLDEAIASAVGHGTRVAGGGNRVSFRFPPVG